MKNGLSRKLFVLFFGFAVTNLIAYCLGSYHGYRDGEIDKAQEMCKHRERNGYWM